MPHVNPTPTLANDPKTVKVSVSTGTGMEIEWKDGTTPAIRLRFCAMPAPAPCATKSATNRTPAGRNSELAPGALPMFKATAKPTAAEGVGKYAIRFSWNDGHDLGIYSWAFLREVCPCEECKIGRAKVG